MNNLKLIIVSMSATLCVHTVMAEPVNESTVGTTNRVKTSKVTPEMRAKRIEQAGGFVTKPGSQKGKIAFINTQDDVPSDVFEDLAATERKHNLYNVVYEKSERGDPAMLKGKSKAEFAVVIVADDSAPAALSALEDGWAVVNVRKLAGDLKTNEAKDKFLPSRCQKEVLRALASVSGGLRSQYPNNVLSLTKISDLDFVKSAFIPNDAFRAMKKYMAARGVTPHYRCPYFKACEEGWAPAPTNEYQRAVWDKVHAIPNKPMKITFDPAAQKGKVTK